MLESGFLLRRWTACLPDEGMRPSNSTLTRNSRCDLKQTQFVEMLRERFG
jgi:hypothetical protein